MKTKALYIYTPIILLTLIISFFLRFDISNGGSSSDLYYHWIYIVALNQDISILLDYNHTYKWIQPTLPITPFNHFKI